MAMMKAIVFDKVGGPEVLTLRDWPRPEAAAGEVLVRVRACALNLLDYYLRIEDDPEMPMPHILGSDIAGEVVACGEGVTGWDKGDAVIVAAAIERADARPQIIGYQTQGGYAQFAVVPAKNLLPKPSNLSYEEAASLPLAYVTAYHQAVTQGGVSSSDVVLVTGASGGVGSACLQICKTTGAFVIGTTSTAGKEAQLRKLGADAVVIHGHEDWPDRVLEVTGGRPPSLVCDNLGGTFLEQGFSLLAHGGRLISVGSTTGGEIKISLGDLFRKEAHLVGSYMGTFAELGEVVRLASLGRIRPVIHNVFRLDEAAEAHRMMEARQHFGKIVLSIP